MGFRFAATALASDTTLAFMGPARTVDPGRSVLLALLAGQGDPESGSTYWGWWDRTTAAPTFGNPSRIIARPQGSLAYSWIVAVIIYGNPGKIILYEDGVEMISIPYYWGPPSESSSHKAASGETETAAGAEQEDMGDPEAPDIMIPQDFEVYFRLSSTSDHFCRSDERVLRMSPGCRARRQYSRTPGDG